MTNKSWAEPNPYWANHWQNPQYRKVSMDQAMQIALQQVPGQVVKAELEYDNGMLIYEIDIRTSDGHKYEVKIDANTGNVLKVKLD
ncbi:PepSY domain-containing protein [Sporosarcina aquimarina]|uniref:PepSY domain-containing protein n=1 Tax=Sporosarcina aquimarina TaxID=114975 RepID=A0ABU4G2Z0_9BACL|nr:PepSY domain-containing protein [Sporosarcina aquimarina]MDW0110732.1 PepSY domain-containing protein [Sporosarcina aquimarina]